MSKLFGLLNSMIDKINSSVKVTSQKLTDEQRAQARANIGLGDAAQLNMLIEEDMLPAVHDQDGKILTDENGNIILRY